MKRLTPQQVFEKCIEKQLEKYNLHYDDVKNFKPEDHGGVQWYRFYTFDTAEEYQAWKEFCVALIKEERKVSSRVAAIEFAWLDLNHGLKQTYEVEL